MLSTAINRPEPVGTMVIIKHNYILGGTCIKSILCLLFLEIPIVRSLTIRMSEVGFFAAF